MMKIDVLIAEIGSTTTTVSAFDKIESEHPVFLGQGIAPTTVLQGDVNRGLKEAIIDLTKRMNVTSLVAKETFASSSAAGGLKMSVHGLVYDMTVRAAKEAALGAGANIHYITAGKLTSFDLDKIKTMNLNIILIAGGVDYGEQETALENAKAIAKLQLCIPVIYAGNIVNQDAVKQIFTECHQESYLSITENVYPKIDVLQVNQVRKIIQNVFENHITKAPGMQHLKESINQRIIPTPGAVLEASILMQKEIGNLVTFDVGGATTDIHSVSDESEDIKKIQISPEPFAKRTVEGDLGVFINKNHIIDIIGFDTLAKDLSWSEDQLNEQLKDYLPIPKREQIPLVERLTQVALEKALLRHAGKLTELYSSTGKIKIAEGKDLTNVSTIIATGGALTKLPNRKQIIESVLQKYDPLVLKPKTNAKITYDRHYVMASLGVLSLKYPRAALLLLKNSLEWGDDDVPSNRD